MNTPEILSLANKLDASGMVYEADEVDRIVKAYKNKRLNYTLDAPGGESSSLVHNIELMHELRDSIQSWTGFPEDAKQRMLENLEVKLLELEADLKGMGASINGVEDIESDISPVERRMENLY